MNRLFKIQQELKAPKNLYNSFGDYAYRNAEGILEALKPLLSINKLILLLNDELVNIGDRYYIKSTVNLIDIDNGKTIAETSAFAREEEHKKGMDGSQITGASSSYARKYALNGMFLIDDVKDSDTTNNFNKEEEQHNKNNEEELKCPKCGGKITKQALEAWNMCAKCKQAEKKENK